MSDEGQSIVVSGGSRGLGQALVADLLAAGHRVATFSRSETDFIQQQRAQDPEGHSFLWESVDGTDFDRLRESSVRGDGLARPRVVFVFPGQGSQHPGMCLRVTLLDLDRRLPHRTWWRCSMPWPCSRARCRVQSYPLQIRSQPTVSLSRRKADSGNSGCCA